MSDTQSVDLLKSQNEDLKNSVANLQDKVDELTKANSEAGIQKLESEIQSLSDKLEATEKELNEATANIDALNSEKTELSNQLKEVSEAKEELETQVTEAKEAQIKANRISHLVDGGVTKDVAEAKVETFANLNDEQFEAVAEDIIFASKMKDKEDDKEKKEDKSKASNDKSSDDISEDEAESKASEDVLENVEASDEPNLTVEASDNEEDSMKSIRSELQKVLASHLGYDIEDDETESN